MMSLTNSVGIDISRIKRCNGISECGHATHQFGRISLAVDPGNRQPTCAHIHTRLNHGGLRLQIAFNLSDTGGAVQILNQKMQMICSVFVLVHKRGGIADGD